MTDFAAARRTMVENQLRTFDVLDYDTLEAMGEIPRELFVPADRQSMAYLDRQVDLGHGRSLMIPMIFGRMIQALDIRRSDKVLDVAVGTGYSTAVLAKLAGEVVALESIPAQLAAARANLAALGIGNVRFVEGPIDGGHGETAPYDLIFVNGAVETEPTTLLGQLAEGGRLAVVTEFGRSGKASLYRRSGQSVSNTRIIDAGAVRLAEFQRPPAFQF